MALYVILFKIVSVSVTSVRQAIGFRPKSSAIVDRIHTDCLYYNSLRKYPYVSHGEVLLAVMFFSLTGSMTVSVLRCILLLGESWTAVIAAKVVVSSLDSTKYFTRTPAA